MVLAAFILVAAAGAQLASAHFGIEYPTWRANTLSSSTNYSQWTQPCAGAPVLPDANRTDWPLKGGSLKLDLHHAWTYIFVNLGLGVNVTNFNYTLSDPFWNSTGNGTLCVKSLPLPTNLPATDGTKATIQVVTLGESGNALYNCADVTLRANATALSDSECVTDPGVSYVPVQQASTAKSAGTMASVDIVSLSAVAGLALVFVFGMSL
ncbi:hypothetical protein B0T26DRAFT_633024 [Lasiosphaeria miniovina]|uniref:Copper acquisition factor BIM1-like domain-containing protein n=1 Tax=Lasiosphaeria miniovina TaxID=1954250 RepID=A0AA40BJ15_9PEZI|nr:uncharacterized protein B0T26DRAFT_633024 [Lasiosphaeria miniovina]KAK0735135.1 hypothetical protein B0T26DRAFT_633024 [Lasiosphaeria miniovina]